jgi:hypothetical protein
LLPDHGVSKGKFLGMLYSHNQDIMDKSFAPMTKEPMLFYDINVNERMSSTPCTIAAFVLISHRGFADYDIRVGAIARDICQKFVIDLVMDVKKRLVLCFYMQPRNAYVSIFQQYNVP